MSKHAILGLFRSLYFSGLAMNINCSIVCPWFVQTGIIEKETAFAIAGLPLGTVENVVLAILRAASDESVNGDIMSVDSEGVLAIPYDSFISGDGGYCEFSRAVPLGHLADFLALALHALFRSLAYHHQTKPSPSAPQERSNSQSSSRTSLARSSPPVSSGPSSSSAASSPCSPISTGEVECSTYRL